MTFGIDVSKNQRGISFAKAEDEGVEFCIVKAAGFNTGSLYVADEYHTHIDNLLKTKIKRGHYYIIGKGNINAQADYFTSHLYKFDKAHDVLAIDNEPLDSNPVFMHQEGALAFAQRIHDNTGIPFNRIWLYCPAALTRDNAPWDKVTSKGIRIWWSAYGDEPTGHTPDHTPSLQGKISRWDIHQFTEQARVAGFNVDGNYSKHSVNTLFGYSTPQPTTAPATTTVSTRYTTAVQNVDGDGWAFVKPSSALTTRIQRDLGARRRYSGPANGIFNLDTAIGVQKTIQNVGYDGPLDGKIREIGCELIQKYAQTYGSYAGPLDKELGLYTWTGFALGLERP